MSLKLLNQINEFRNNRDQYTDGERQLLSAAFRQEIKNAARAEKEEKGLLDEDLIFI